MEKDILIMGPLSIAKLQLEEVYMGADGHIEISRFVAGSLAGAAPYFTVTEPIIILPVFTSKFTEGWTNLGTSYERLNTQIRYFGWTLQGTLVCLHRNNDRFPLFAILVLSRKKMMDDSTLWKEIIENPPGLTSIDELLTIWDKFTPGVWVVTSYWEKGMGEDRFYFCNYQPLGHCSETIRYSIWT